MMAVVKVCKVMVKFWEMAFEVMEGVFHWFIINFDNGHG
jgi:hypothetical protein